MRSNFKLSADVFVVILMFACQVIDYLFYLSRGVFTLLPLFFIWLVIVTSNNKRASIFYSKVLSIRTELLFLILFIVGVYFNYIFIMQTTLAEGQFLIFLQYLPIIIVSSYYTDFRNSEAKNTILFILVILLGVQAAVSIPFILTNDPTFIRYLSNGDLRTEEMSELARRNGVGTNSLYSSLPAIVILAYDEYSNIHKYSFFIRFVVYCCVTAMITTILISTFTASIFLLIVGILLYFVYKFSAGRHKGKYVLSLLIISVIFYWIFDMFLIQSEWFQPVMYKVQLFQESDGGDVTGRDKLALVSLNSFLDAPLFGVGVPEKNSYDIIGAHLPWLDSLATYGVVVFGFFMLFFVKRISKVRNIFRIQDDYTSNRIACGVGITLFIISNFISPMLYVPISYIFFYFFYTSFPEKHENINVKSRYFSH